MCQCLTCVHIDGHRSCLEPPSMPGKPLETSNIDPTSISISWQPSASSGSSSITSYIIERRDALKAHWTLVKKVSSSQFNVLITELTEGSNYYFRVCAINDDDLQSEWLELDPPVLCRNPYDVPSPPRNLHVNDILGQTVHLQWDAPENDGGKPIRAYIIERRDVHRATWLKEGRCKTTNYEIESLPLNTQHSIRVTAENEEGLSAACEIERPIQIDAKDSEPSHCQSCRCLFIDFVDIFQLHCQKHVMLPLTKSKDNR
jgi:predicted phage tail protein